MSIARCDHCQTNYDQDFDLEEHDHDEIQEDTTSMEEKLEVLEKENI